MNGFFRIGRFLMIEQAFELIVNANSLVRIRSDKLLGKRKRMIFWKLIKLRLKHDKCSDDYAKSLVIKEMKQKHKNDFAISQILSYSPSFLRPFSLLIEPCLDGKTPIEVIFEQYEPLAKSLAKKFRRKYHLPSRFLPDLIADAQERLIHAIYHYDKPEMSKFITYAYHVIGRHLQRQANSSQYRFIETTPSNHMAWRQYQKEKIELQNKLGRSVGATEVIQSLQRLEKYNVSFTIQVDDVRITDKEIYDTSVLRNEDSILLDFRDLIAAVNLSRVEKILLWTKIFGDQQARVQIASKLRLTQSTANVYTDKAFKKLKDHCGV